MATGERLRLLLEKWRLQQATEPEQQELLNLLESADSKSAELADLQQEWSDSANGSAIYEKADQTITFVSQYFPAGIRTGNHEEPTIKTDAPPPVIPVHRVHLLKTAWFRVAIAALVVIGVSVIVLNNRKPGRTYTQHSVQQTQILAATNKAILKLSNGSVIALDSIATGTIAEQNGTRIKKVADGSIVYVTETGITSSTTLNTMSTPAGGQYQLVLADGTKVWLNAESSITYPTAFKEQEREVTISGEVYLEVKANAQSPFIVNTANTEKITVLGTSFNIYAYPGETTSKVSLVEGAVKVGAKMLKPGQAFENGNINSTDLNQDLAWKNGFFSLSNKTVEQLMREIARWYNVKIEYPRGAVTARLFGEMDRNLTLNEALEGLNGVDAEFKLEGRTVYVLPL